MNFYRVAPICFMLLFAVLLGLIALLAIQMYKQNEDLFREIARKKLEISIMKHSAWEEEFIKTHYTNADQWVAEVKEKGNVERH